MPRWCGSCGRPVEDHPSIGQGKMKLRSCELVLVARTQDGYVYRPENGRRTRHDRAAFVHEANLERELAEGPGLDPTRMPAAERRKAAR